MGPPALTGNEAAIELARLLERYLHFPAGSIEAGWLKMALEVNWSKFSYLAHVIHERDEEEKKITLLCPDCGGLAIHCVHGQQRSNFEWRVKHRNWQDFGATG
jgi:hypothetical protein